MFKTIAILAALILTLAAPFFLRPAKTGHIRDPDKILVIVSPHNETIRAEFTRAFRAHMLATRGLDIRVEWRVPGGTSEIEKYVHSAYVAAFEHYWKRTLHREWSDHEIGEAFNNRRVNPAGDSPGEEARRIFLESDVGIGIDLMFGGGEYPFVIQAQSGHLVDSGIFERRPEWFQEDIIPAKVSGETFYDPDHRWIGACLSSFGICYNTDSLQRLRMDPPPDSWSDLGSPKFFTEIALADPTKSGSVTKAFEMLIQQRIREVLENLEPVPGETPEAHEARALRLAWRASLNLIQRICANARYFTDSSSKIPLDVAQGNATAGMCIDYYGRTSNEMVRKLDGSSRVQYLTPVGGSSVSVDPIAMLRGAPEPELALDFIEFVLSPEGQKLWNYRVGAPGGPRDIALRRLPLRKDLYTPEYLRYFSDPDVLPYDAAQAFEYRREWTAGVFGPIRFIIRCMCIDPHEEMRVAWKKISDANFPEQSTRMFFDVGFVSYDKANGFISDTLKSGFKLAEVNLARELSAQFRGNYLRAAKMADRGL